MTRITILAGGVGGAKFISGARSLARACGYDITVVANTGDDMWLTGLRVCPDLDSIMYALGGANDTSRGWGRAGETERVSAELTAYGVGWPWFTLGDLDLGTHIARTSMLREGLSLTEATNRLSMRWNLGVELLPATDDEVETMVEFENTTGEIKTMHFEKWWVKYRSTIPARRFLQEGITGSRASDHALEAIRTADVVLLAPSNPVVSIGTIVALPGMKEALRATSAPVIGLSPIIAGSPVRGMADSCLAAIGVDTSAEAVGRHYGPRLNGGLLDGWIVDTVDDAAVTPLTREGIPTATTPLWMTDDDATASMVQAALDLAHTTHGPTQFA